MHRSLIAGHAPARAAVTLAVATILLAGGADPAAGTDGDAAAIPEILGAYSRTIGHRAVLWYQRTPPADRVTWGGLAACAGLGLGVVLERLVRLRQRRIIPREFLARYLERLRQGKLDKGKALDFCELNPSPAARVALAAIRRWGRPIVDLERAVALAQRTEANQLRRNLGTLRRLAALLPLLGLLGTLFSAGRVLSDLGGAGGAGSPAWGPLLAGALSPMTAAVALAIVALVAYDGLSGRVEALIATLDRLGAETIDAIALATPVEPRPVERKAHGASGPRFPHPLRIEIPDALVRPKNREDGPERA